MLMLLPILICAFQTIPKGFIRVGNQQTNRERPNYSISRILRGVLEEWGNLHSPQSRERQSARFRKTCKN